MIAFAEMLPEHRIFDEAARESIGCGNPRSFFIVRCPQSVVVHHTVALVLFCRYAHRPVTDRSRYGNVRAPG